MTELHRFIGFLVVALFALGWIWGLGAAVLRRGGGPGELFWRWLTVAQITAVVQAILGIALLLFGRRVSAGGEGLGSVLHYVYGLLPILLFAIAHVIARSGDLSMLGVKARDGRPIRISAWVPFAWASFISFGLTLRALMTGLGIG